MHKPTMSTLGPWIVRCLWLIPALTGSSWVDESRAGEPKVYFNLELPGGSPFCPIVLSATERSAVVARVYSVSGRREIQVMEGKGDHWTFVGRNGEAITGADGNFLKGAGRAADGSLWIVAGYTPPSNKDRGFKDFLYVFEDGAWKHKGPPDGQEAGFWGDEGYHLLASRFVRLYWDTAWQFVGLEGVRWVELPAQALVRPRFERIAWRRDDAWFIRRRTEADQSSLEAYWVKGPRKEDIVGPLRLESWKGNVECLEFAVAPDGTIALFGSTGDPNDRKTWFGRLYRPRKDLTFVPSELPVLPGPSFIPLCFEWSPRGLLHVVISVHAGKIAIDRFEKDRWVACGEASQNVWRIFGPRLFFRDDGTPIVVWQDFLPH